MSPLDLVGLLQGRVAEAGAGGDARAGRAEGVTVGKVTDIEDTQHLGRVKVELPRLSGCVESAWARIALPWAGQRRGSYLLPEVGDEVLVSFQHGDVRFPYVVGFLWNEKAVPPETTPSLERRELRSKSGHTVVFDDTKGREKLTLHSQGGHDVTLDDGAGTVTISAAGGKVTITLKKSGALEITGTSSLDLSAPQGKVTIAGATIDVRAKGTLTLDGGSVEIAPPAMGDFPAPSDSGGLA